MRSARHIFTVDAHAGGEPIRVVIGGIPNVPGASMADKKRYISENLDYLRTTLLHEPRGHRDMFGALLVEPTHPEAALGVVFMDSGGYLNMCGHGTIGVVTAAIEMGFVAASEPVCELALDTPAGLVRTTAQVHDNVVTAVTMRNVPSFLYASDVVVEVPGGGSVNIDISFGGNFVALVPAAQLGIEIAPQNVSAIIELGTRLLAQINDSVSVAHPTAEHIKTVDLLEFFAEPRHPDAHAQNAVVFGKGSLDRSPCGTGTCAKMAALHAKGKLSVGERFVHESIIGTLFEGRLVEQTKVGEFAAVVPEITGSGFITATGQLLIDPLDPLRNGFLVA